ncbi:MAG: hypothetical protein ACTHMM_00300 [Agriterribacter sp.]
MKISWNDNRHIERYLNSELSEEEKILFEAQLVLDPHLKLNVGLLKRIHSLIKLYGRRKMRAEIGKIHHKLFQNPEHVIFQQRIQRLFKDN